MRRALARVAVLLLAAASTGTAHAAPADVVGHEITVRLDPAAGCLEATDRITFEGPGTVWIALATWLTIDSLTVDGTPASVPVSVGPGRHILLVEYSGTPPTSGAARIADDGTFLPAGSGWVPDTGNGPAPYRLTVEVPAGQRAVATGKLIEETGGGDQVYRATFASDDPLEPPSLFAGPYAVMERMHGAVRLRTWFHAEVARLADAYLGQAAAYLDRFAEAIGPYPYADFHMVSAPLPVGLGFPGIAYVSRRILPLPFMRGRSLAHEIAHNWWGNGVGIDYASGNWAEGLTTYMADYALAADGGADAAREMRLNWLRDYAVLPKARDGPVTAFVSRRHDAAQVIGYNKAAMIFHMLRAEIGEDRFAAGLRRFWRDNRFRTAAWDHLRTAFETETGTDLGWFFGQWLTRTGAPMLELASAEAAKTDAGYRVTVTLRQPAPAYRLSVPVTVETAIGPVHRTIPLTALETEATIETKAQPVEVLIDPGFDLFRRMAPAEAPAVLRDVTLDPSAAVVLATEDASGTEAARALAGRLIDGTPAFVDAGASVTADRTLMIIGTGAGIDDALKAYDLGAVPDAVAGTGTSTARVWTGRRSGGAPFAVIAADDAEAVSALVRPLPHYRRIGYAAFVGTKILTRGTWPPGASPLRKSHSVK